MSAAAQAPAAADSAEGEAPKKGGKKKLILIAVPVLLVVVLAGLWFSGILPGLLGMGKPPAAAEAAASVVARVTRATW